MHAEPLQITLPLAYMGGVNVWLLRGEPLTLVDTGPATDEALASLEEQLSALGLAIEDLEQVLLTHHHLDHTGLAATIGERSGATVVAHRSTARYGEHYHDRVRDERRFTLRLLEAHGVPDGARTAAEPFFTRLIAESRPFRVDRALADGERVRAGDRTLRAVLRPGHSTTDTLFVDEALDEAFVGDHLLANISSAVELGATELPGDERRLGLMDYLGNLRRTQVMPLRRCFAGHGPLIDDHAALIEERLGFHTDRMERIAGLVEAGARTAYEIARELWSPAVAEANPVLVVWEVLGHLDLLVNRGVVREELHRDGGRRYVPRVTDGHRADLVT